MRFPIVGSVTLFGLFLVLKLVPNDVVNAILSIYFSTLGTFSLASLLGPLGLSFFPKSSFLNSTFRFARKIPYVDLISFEATGNQLMWLLLSSPIAFLYYKTKHWLLSNLLGIAFSVQALETVSLGRFSTAAVLLCGLFIYGIIYSLIFDCVIRIDLSCHSDIFWVFGTNKILSGESVMVTVAKGLDVPIKFLFPRQISTSIDITVESKLRRENANFWGDRVDFSMLGLGDVVIPGFLLALLIRFDAERAKAFPQSRRGAFPRPYFVSAMAGYAIGLCLTIAVMTHFGAAQPALLYLVPACLGATILTGFVRGELTELFAYDEEAKEPAEEKSTQIPPPPSSNDEEKKSK